jgi:hypothetical protein
MIVDSLLVHGEQDIFGALQRQDWNISGVSKRGMMTSIATLEIDQTCSLYAASWTRTDRFCGLS